MDRITRNAPVLLLGGALAVAAVALLALTATTTHYADTWAFLMERRDFSVENTFHPHNEHLVAIPVLIEQVILRLFGMGPSLPEQVVLTICLLGTATLLYVYVQRRVGPWLALFAAVLVLFLGPAWEVLLWPFEIALCGPILCGLGMLLMLEREDRIGDLCACALLILALGFSSLGVPFIAGAAVAVAMGDRSTWLRRAYVFVIPALLFLLWYAGWGSDAESHLSLRNLLASPRFVAESIAVSVGALAGLGTNPVTGTIEPVWGRPLAVALAIGLGVFVHRRRAIYAGLWPVAAVAAANWLLTAFNAFPGRDPSASRYQYAGAIFVLMIVANLLHGFRPGRKLVLAGAALTALAVAPNFVIMHDAAKGLKTTSVLTRADTAAIEIARDRVPSDFQLNPELAGTPTLINIYAEKYLDAVDEYGSPAYSPEELAAAPEAGRHQADIVLSQALGLSTVIQLGEYAGSAAAGCVVVAGGEGPSEVEVAGGSTVELAPGPRAELSLRRFAVEEYPVALDSPPGGSTTELRIPRDRAEQPWVLRVEAEQAARVCAP